MSHLYIDNKRPNIVVFGDVMLDYNIQGICNKIANEGPIPVVNVANESYSIGGCGNVVLNSLGLGADTVYLFSRIGNDDNGSKLVKLLPNCVQNMMIIDNSFPTITKTRIYSDKKLVARYDREIVKNIDILQEDYILSKFKNLINTVNIDSVIFSDYNKGFLTRKLCQDVITLCNLNSIPTIVDPKVDYIKYINCTIFKPNRLETKNIFNIDLNNTPLEDAHKLIHSKVNCKLSVITLSGDGMSAYDNNTFYKAREETKDVIDVTGAGDVVCSVLGVYYNYIDDKNTLLQIANHLASISISHLGVYTINKVDLFNTSKLVYKTKLICIQDIIDLDLKQVVFTNGCFDIIHSAHIELFKFCRSLGRTVILGLNSDSSIKRLKGDTRPIYTLEDRLKILESIEYIDYIIPFDEDTPIELIKKIKPMYLVKGGDYTKEAVIGKEYTKEVIIFDYINGKSTTNTILKIQNTIY